MVGPARREGSYTDCWWEGLFPTLNQCFHCLLAVFDENRSNRIHSQACLSVMSNGRLSVLCSQPLESCFQFSALFAASSSGPIQIATDAPRGRGLPGILAGPRRFKRQKVSGSGLVARHNGHTLPRHCAAEDCRFGRKGRQAPTAIRVPHLQGSVVGGRNGLPTLPRHRHCSHRAADLGPGYPGSGGIGEGSC